MRKQLLESTSFGNPRLDKERGVVRGVKILGMKSSHGYRYSPDAVRGAAKLYEGKAVNIDHPSDRSKLGVSRSYRDRFAKLLQIRYVEGKGLFGDLHYNRGHQSRLLGLLASHVQEGRRKQLLEERRLLDKSSFDLRSLLN